MTNTDRWLEPYQDLVHPAAFLGALRDATPLPGDTSDPEEYFRELLVSVEWHYLSTRQWNSYFLTGQRGDDVLTSPRTAIAAGVDTARNSQVVQAGTAAMLVEAYLKSRRVRAAELCAGVAYVQGDRSPAVLGVLVGRAIREERNPAARELVAEAKHRYPGQPETVYGEARYRMAIGELDAAVTCLGELVRDYPGYRPAWEMLMQAHLLRKDWTAAVEVGRKATEALPAHVAFWEQLSRAHLAAGRTKDARKALRTALKRAKDNSDYSAADRAGIAFRLARLEQRCDQPVEALEHYRFARSEGNDAPTVFEGIATCLQRTGHDGEAESVLTEGLERHPEDLALKATLGKLFFKTRRDPQAFELLQEVAEKDASRTDCILLMAIVCLRNRHFAETVELASSVISSGSSQALEALLLLGDAYHFQGADDAALEAYRAARAMAPEQPEIEERIVSIRQIRDAAKAGGSSADT